MEAGLEAPDKSRRRDRRTERVAANEKLRQPAERSVILQWDHHVPLVTNLFMLWDLLRFTFAIGLLVEVMAFATTALIDREPVILPLEIVLGMMGAVVVLYVLVAGAVFKNDWHVRFTLDSKGVSCYGHLETGILFRLLMWARLLTFSLPIVLIALWRRGEGGGVDKVGVEGGSRVAWKDVRKVTVHERPRVITVSGSVFEFVRLYCTPEVFDAARREATFRGEFADARRRERPEKPFEVSGGAWRVLIWALLSGAGTLAGQLWKGESTAFLVGAAGALVLLSGLTEGRWRRVCAALGLLVSALYLVGVRDLAYRFTEFAGGIIKIYEYEHDTPELIVSLTGGVLLLAMASWRLLGPARKGRR